MQNGFSFPERLSEKLRPRILEDFVGLELPKAILESFVANPRPDAFFFFGPSGTGKTSMGLAICEAVDGELHHIPSKNCDKETIENTVRTCYRQPYEFFGPNAGKSHRFHVILIDEMDQATGAAQSALLSLTDATAWPPNTIWIFTANGKLLLEPRFLSRCRKIEFPKPNGELPQYLAQVYKREGGKNPPDFSKIAEESEHNVRDAINRLEDELAIDSKRKSLPVMADKARADHEHKCAACKVMIPCSEQDCRKAAVTKTCPVIGAAPELQALCAGKTTEGSERTRRAWETRKEKARGK